MSNTRLIVFDVHDLARLITHYSEGAAMPLDAEVQGFAVHPTLQRLIQLTVRSADWPSDLEVNKVTGELTLLQFRYEDKRTLSWNGMQPAEADGRVHWSEPGYAETPERQ